MKETGARFVIQMSDIPIELRQILTHAQELQTAEANKHLCLHAFQQREKGFISTRNLPMSYATLGKNEHRMALSACDPLVGASFCLFDMFFLLARLIWRVFRRSVVYEGPVIFSPRRNPRIIAVGWVWGCYQM